MLTKDERNRIADYFEPWELVQLLGGDVDIDDLIDFLEDEIENALEDLNDLMKYNPEKLGVFNADRD